MTRIVITQNKEWQQDSRSKDTHPAIPLPESKSNQVDHLHRPWLRGEGDRLEDPGAASPGARSEAHQVSVWCISEDTRKQDGDVQGRCSSRQMGQVQVKDGVRVHLRVCMIDEGFL